MLRMRGHGSLPQGLSEEAAGEVTGQQDGQKSREDCQGVGGRRGGKQPSGGRPGGDVVGAYGYLEGERQERQGRERRRRSAVGLGGGWKDADRRERDDRLNDLQKQLDQMRKMRA